MLVVIFILLSYRLIKKEVRDCELKKLALRVYNNFSRACRQNTLLWGDYSYPPELLRELLVCEKYPIDELKPNASDKELGITLLEAELGTGPQEAELCTDSIVVSPILLDTIDVSEDDDRLTRVADSRLSAREPDEIQVKCVLLLLVELMNELR